MRQRMPLLLSVLFIVGMISATRSHAAEQAASASASSSMAFPASVQVAQLHPVEVHVPGYAPARLRPTPEGTAPDDRPVNTAWLLGAVALAGLCLKRRIQRHR